VLEGEEREESEAGCVVARYMNAYDSAFFARILV
jgi:hypothetical protein